MRNKTSQQNLQLLKDNEKIRTTIFLQIHNLDEIKKQKELPQLIHTLL